MRLLLTFKGAYCSPLNGKTKVHSTRVLMMCTCAGSARLCQVVPIATTSQQLMISSLSRVVEYKALGLQLRSNICSIVLGRLEWMAGMAAANIWDSMDRVDTWPCDLSDTKPPVKHFEFVPVEMREQVRLFLVHMCWLELNPTPHQLGQSQ